MSFFEYLTDPFTREALLSQALVHVQLTIVPMLIATVVGIASGIVAHRNARLRSAILTLYSTLLTIPSFALFALFIGTVGIGNPPAIIALTLYALLAITRNTVSGLGGVDRSVVESAKGMGLSDRQRLLRIELPIAWPVILTGLRVSTQIVIGIAAIAVLVGGGGLGEEIYSNGLRRMGSPGAVNSILGGTLAIVVLAVLFDLAFQLLGRLTISKGLDA